MTSTPAERNLAAETRAVEEGHRAISDGYRYRIVSDTDPDKHYRVTPSAHAAGDFVSFSCSPTHDGAADHGYAYSGAPGTAGCKHAALAARRLEREGRARLDEAGRWVALGPVGAALEAILNRPADPLEGLPR